MAGLHFLRRRFLLVERHRELARSDDCTASADDVHLDGGEVARALLVDPKHREHHLLQCRAAVNITAPRTLQAQAVDRLGDLHLYPAGKTEPCGSERVQPRRSGKSLAEDETAVSVKNLLPLHFAPREVALLDGAVLVDEAVVGGDQYIVHVGARELLDQADNFVQ